jgi:hypothetical protein
VQDQREIAHGLNPLDPSDSAQPAKDGSGYFPTLRFTSTASFNEGQAVAIDNSYPHARGNGAAPIEAANNKGKTGKTDGHLRFKVSARIFHGESGACIHVIARGLAWVGVLRPLMRHGSASFASMPA